MAVESALIGVGRQFAMQLARVWYAPRAQSQERGSSLADLIAVTVPDQIKRRKLSRQLSDIGDSVAARLQAFTDSEFANLPDHEKTAALEAVGDTLSVFDLSDSAIIAANMDARKLLDSTKDAVVKCLLRAGLSEAAEGYYRIVLFDVCGTLLKAVEQLPAYQARAMTEVLARSSRIAADIDTLLERLPRPSLEDSSGTGLDDDFRNRYLQFCSESLDRLELFGVDTRNFRASTSVSVAYLSLKVSRQQAAERRYEARYGAEALEDRVIAGREANASGAYAIEAAVLRNKRLLLRGDAGSGKTTILQWFAVTCARGKFSGALADLSKLVPIFVRLRSFSDRELPMPHQLLDSSAGPLVSGMPAGWVNRQLADGSVMLLIDGLDEILPRRRQAVKAWISDILVAYPTTRILVTSRPAAAHDRWLDELGFASATLEPLNSSGIAAFTERWHEAVRVAANQKKLALPCEPADLSMYQTALLKHLESRRHLRALATNPLMCAMLCALNLDRRSTLPPDRMRLYSDAIELLIDRRDNERDVIVPDGMNMTATVKVNLLQYVAWRFSLAGRSESSKSDVLLHIERALAHIPSVNRTADEVLNFLLERSGLIREPIPGRVDFVHRTFQEFLAAKEAAEDHAVDLLIDRAHADQWRETVIMAAGHLSGPRRDALIEGILRRADSEQRHARKLRILIAACLETAQSMRPDLIQQVDSALAQTCPPRSRRESRSLAMAGERVLQFLNRDLEQQTPAVAAAAIWTATYVGGDESLQFLKSYTSDSRGVVQRELQAVWRYYNAQTFASEVLADAPLADGPWGPGHVQIETPEQLRCVNTLTNMQAAVAHFPLAEGFSSLDEIVATPNLKSLSLWPTRALDLAPLAASQDLESLTVFADGTYGGLSALQSLPLLDRLSLSFRTTGKALLPELYPLVPRLQSLTLAFVDLQDDPSVLEPFASVQDLGLLSCEGVTDLSFLENSHVKALTLSHCGVEDVAVVQTMPYLAHLFISTTPDLDLRPVVESSVTFIGVSHGSPSIDIGVFANATHRVEIAVPKDVEVLNYEAVDRSLVRLRRNW